MIKHNSIPETLFNKLRSMSSHLKIGDKDASPTFDPSEARFFNFNFGIDDIENGDVNINLTDDEIKIYYGRDLLNNLGENNNKWYKFLKMMRVFAKRNMLSFTIKDVSKSDFDKRDYKFIASQDPENKNMEESVNLTFNDIWSECYSVKESNMYGSKKSSYQDIGQQAKIIVKHKKTVGEDIRGSRGRNISKIFIETAGERHELPFKVLIGARAMARHINEGGSLDDPIANHICTTIKEMIQLKSFMNYSKHNNLVTEETEEIIGSVSETYKGMHKSIHNMCSRIGYRRFVENYEPLNDIIEDDENLDLLRDKFTVKITDEQVLSALPLVNRLHNRQIIETSKLIKDFIDNGTLLLQDDCGCDEIAYSVRYDDPAILVRSAMEDIHSRVVGNEIIRNFAGKMKDTDITESENGIFATKLAYKYIDDLSQMRNEKGVNYRNLVRTNSTILPKNKDYQPTLETEIFENWATQY